MEALAESMNDGECDPGRLTVELFRWTASMGRSKMSSKEMSREQGSRSEEAGCIRMVFPLLVFALQCAT